MKIASWNVNGLRARLDFLLIWLRERQPDVVGLQELKLTDDQFPYDLLKEAGYHAVINCQKAWNGVAVLSREPAQIVDTDLAGQEHLGARFLSVDVAGLNFTTVYCPNGKTLTHEDYPLKLAWLRALADRFKGVPSESRVLCGDFNVVPAAIDSWMAEKADGRIFHTDDERARLTALKDTGLIDLFRDLYPHQQTFSWWDYRGGAFHRGQGLRIDHIYVSKAVRDRAIKMQTDRDYRKKKEGLTASDHAPVIAELDG